jgi:hypothetical protein
MSEPALLKALSLSKELSGRVFFLATSGSIFHTRPAHGFELNSAFSVSSGTSWEIFQQLAQVRRSKAMSALMVRRRGNVDSAPPDKGMEEIHRFSGVLATMLVRVGESLLAQYLRTTEKEEEGEMATHWG